MTDWRVLASAQLDGVATAEEQAELESWLSEHPSNADDYVVWLELHEALRSQLGEAGIRLRVGAESGLGLEIAPQPSGNESVLARHPLPSLVAWTAAVAATLLIALWGNGMLRLPGEDIIATLDPPREKPAETLAATLTGAVDCRWASGHEAVRYGEHLESGTVLRLAEGLAQVTYETGAKVVIRGPCEFRVASPSQGILPYGQITAVVPRRAAGFVVQTPCAEIVDLGTEFAIDVDESGNSEVHVFKGEVVSRRRAIEGGAATSADLHLVSLEAARYSPTDASIREFKADDTRFIREIMPRLVESELPRAPQMRGLALWMAADLIVKSDDAGRVFGWCDVLCAGNQSPDDALQANAWERPLLVPGALNGMDAIRFDGVSSHLVTTPMETGPSQTVFLVTRFAADQRGYYPGSLLNYNGPPHRDMTALADRGVLQLGLGPRSGAERGVQAFVYIGASARAGAVDSNPVPSDQPVIVAYTYDMEANRATLMVNGRVEGEASAPAPASSISRRVFGRHGHLPKYFRGDIGEVLIYDRALGSEEALRVADYLSEKYSIAVAGDQGS